MHKKVPFAERAENVLIVSIIAGIVLVAQPFSVIVFRIGLVVLVAATFLQIAVGNVPKHLDFLPSLVRIVIILIIVAALFALGIVLVPYFAQLGR